MRKSKEIITKINYKSDFKLKEVCLEQEITTPFIFTYRTGGTTTYVASFDGSKYNNCRRDEDGSFLIIFDNHNLGIGRLRVTREYFISDSDFADKIYNKISEQIIDLVLTDGCTNDSSTVTVELMPNYIKGEDGLTPYIGKNGNWWIGNTDSGVYAVGEHTDLTNYYQKEEVDSQISAASSSLEEIIDDSLGDIKVLLATI
ncbi:MAG: hypothetical protein R3Y08_01480 [Rikenellaceae bacterium]